MGIATNLYDKDSGLHNFISSAARTLFVTRLILGIFIWLAITAGLWLVLFTIDNLLPLPSTIRFPLAITAVAVTLYTLWRYIIKAVVKKLSHVQVAVMLERKYAIGGNSVVNAMQLSQTQCHESQRFFVDKTIEEGSRNLDSVSVRDLGDLKRLFKWAGLAGLVLMLLAGYIVMSPGYFSNAVDRYMFPLSDVPPASRLTLNVTPGDVAVAESEDVEFIVQVSGLLEEERLEEYPQLYWKEGPDEISTVRGMGTLAVMHPVPDKLNTYRYKFKNVSTGFSLRIFASDAMSRSYHVSVSSAPKITASRSRITSPWYTGAKEESVLGPPNPVECLPGSKLFVELEMSKICSGVFWHTADGVQDFSQVDSKWQMQTVLTRAGRYDVKIGSEDLDKNMVVSSGVVSLLADEQPMIDILDTQTSRTVIPGEKVRIKLRGQDRYGLRDIQLVVRPALGGGNIAPVILRTWRYCDTKTIEIDGAALDQTEIVNALNKQHGNIGAPEFVRKSVEYYSYVDHGKVRVDFPPGDTKVVDPTMDIEIDATIFQPGYKYFIEAVARDFCPYNEPRVSKALMFTVKDIDNLKIAGTGDLREVYASLDEAIALQKTAMDHCDTLTTHHEDVWMDMNRKPYEASKVSEILGQHRRLILSKQMAVRLALGDGCRKARGQISRLVARMKAIHDNQAVDANDRASMLHGVVCQMGMGDPVFCGRLGGKQGNTVAVKSDVKSRFLGLLVQSVGAWDQKSSLNSITLIDNRGKSIPLSGGKIVASRGGQASQSSMPWRGQGPLPHYVVVDLGKPQIISGVTVACGKTSIGLIRLYLTSAKKVNVTIPEMPDMESLLRDASALRRIQEKIYNELIALKGQEIASTSGSARDDAERDLEGEGMLAPPMPDEAVEKLKEELDEWNLKHMENAKIRDALMNKLAESFNEDDHEALQAALEEQESLGQQLKDFVNNFTTTAGVDEGDSQQAEVNAEIVANLDKLVDLENKAIATAGQGGHTESLDNQIALTAEGAAGVSKKEENSSSGDVPGGAECPEDASVPPFTPKLASKLSAQVTELNSTMDSISENSSFAGTSMGGALGQNPQDNIVGGQYSSYASAGQMGDESPDPMKNVGGRSGVGRSGQCDGNFTGSSSPAIPDDIPHMPNRMSDGSLEAGEDVHDAHTAAATSIGLGKSTDKQSQFGESGRMPPEMGKRLRDCGQEAATFKESCEDLYAELSGLGIPHDDLKMAAHRMDEFMEAMRKGDGEGIRRAYGAVVHQINLSRLAILRELELRAANNSENYGPDDCIAMENLEELKGYEEKIAHYFTVIAGLKEWDQ